MAQAKTDGVKRPLLLAFVGISVVLIVMILVNGFAPTKDEGNPGFYRGQANFSEGTRLTMTAISQEFHPTSTPDPNHTPGSGTGSGSGSGNH